MHLQTTVTRVLITTTIALSFALASTSTLAHAETKSVPIACQELQADVETWTKKLKEAESSHDQLSKNGHSKDAIKRYLERSQQYFQECVSSPPKHLHFELSSALPMFMSNLSSS
ncbi:Hypothetical protein Cul210931_1746 [Corynebacterium ulcerans]|uniref:Secreted protein n=1 Tax=Corynebacterium ulcerans FRC58 TaxID=1408268 RepID=A0ABN4H2A2_CORUL|nr:hypothetical protein [Corynebacterium ulcerans]AIU31071.1 Hypothetical protein Cul210931_1746 [Corynebacterium ulcerans]AIU92395.1 Hypothetical protein Cul05146_1843 [Corynebacterium ulcerans]AKN77738.1 Hypothetical protein CulFRC58_1884 [Corynebacterium ulcerans FRC58]NOL62994.1 hypothetical protein [Corynebacterium ulcerans]NON15485.1 hypothetical protein [Corynebacterium ulcerans]